MRESQPVASVPVIATTEWVQAIRHFCHHERVYDGPTANAWLVGAGLLVPSSALIRSVLKYVSENREDIPFGTLPPSWVVKQLEQAGLISHRCAAVLHFQDQNYRFSTVVRIDPRCIWPDERLRPEAFITSPINSLELRVLESLATPNARGRTPSPVRLAILARASTTTPPEHPRPTATPPALHAVLATYPELAFPEWFPVARSSDAQVYEQRLDETDMPDLHWSGIGLGGTPDSITGCVRHPLPAEYLGVSQQAGKRP